MTYRFDDFEVDPESFELRRAGAVLPVEPLVFELICFLAANPNRVLSRDEIIAGVWQGRIVSDATIAGCVKSARKALGDSGGQQSRIRTVRGRGFRFVGDVSSAEPPPRAEPPAQPAPASERPVLAVLPFRNMGGDKEAYFADGISEDIITNLGRFRELQVIARSSSFQFRAPDLDLADVARRLNATYLVEGSVRRAGGRLRVTAELVEPASGTHLWADHYDRDVEDLFAVQDEVANTIVATLGVSIQDAGQRRAMRKTAAELDAYDCVLRARRFTTILTAVEHIEARALLETAIERDPTSADAHALLANVYLAEHRFDLNPRPEPIERAMAMAKRAVQLDPRNAYARCWLAVVHFFSRENDAFEAEAARALALNPNDPEILADIGHFRAFMGQFEAGVALSRQAIRLNPLHPAWYRFSAARYHYDRKDYAASLAELLAMNMPDFFWQPMLAAAAQGQLGVPEAVDSLQQAEALKPGLDPRVELAKWNAAPDDLEHIMEGLVKAGYRPARAASD